MFYRVGSTSAAGLHVEKKTICFKSVQKFGLLIKLCTSGSYSKLINDYMKIFSYNNSLLKHYCLPGCDAVYLVHIYQSTRRHVPAVTLVIVGRTSNPTISLHVLYPHMQYGQRRKIDQIRTYAGADVRVITKSPLKKQGERVRTLFNWRDVRAQE
jgi:hypothetical protein